VFTVKCNNCEAETTFTRIITENGYETVSDTNTLELEAFPDGSGWYIHCSKCTAGIESTK
jgi:hypothetical protein